MGNKWSQLSKEVGWNPPSFPMPYPTMEEATMAMVDMQNRKLLTWYRFLPAAGNETETAVMNKIVDYVMKVRDDLVQQEIE